ncbi:hypothetical protein CKO31_03170 [Thiohalocapsa halophila]|uniref:Glycosyltransferase family 2 protein n=1 Tax=Thiohalocapsa halophila TaxID=69359 RepID=A0ABS1CEA6_9GAMM|nr:hypothetical protein [Thiohalocapsa halophila]MBK1629756.1 hypothetical protein [Thiohalocapsa halophila]
MIYIVRRQSPDWHELATTFSRDGTFDAGALLPSPLPIGFPANLLELVALWNATFCLDFFTVRARIADIAEENWQSLDGVAVYQQREIGNIAQAMIAAGRGAVCFVDDDDWFAPRLATVLKGLSRSKSHIVRWAAPLYDGKLYVRFAPRFFGKWAARSYEWASARNWARALYERVFRALARRPNFGEFLPSDLVLMTNNYAVQARYVSEMQSIACLRDHVEAALLVQRTNLKLRSLPNEWLSLTNKHPCSAGVLGRADNSDDTEAWLKTHVRRFADAATAFRAPSELAWAEPLIRATGHVFRDACPT